MISWLVEIVVLQSILGKCSSDAVGWCWVGDGINGVELAGGRCRCCVTVCRVPVMASAADGAVSRRCSVYCLGAGFLLTARACRSVG